MNMNDLELLLRTPFIDPEYGFDISPDGGRIAFSWNTSGNWEIYEMPMDGSGKPVLRTSGSGGKFAPKYSPDGLHLSFALDLDGSENFHICIIDLPANTTQDLTGSQVFALNTNYSWSPDGKEIVFLSIFKDTYPVNLLPVDGGPLQRVIDFKQPAWDVRWSPAGDRLAVVVETDGLDSSIVIVNMENSEETWLSEGSKQLNAKNPAWSPDGAELAFSSNPSGFYNIGILNLKSKNMRWLTKGDTEKTRPVWSPDGSRWTYIQWEGGNRRLVLHDRSDDKPFSFAVDQGLHTIPIFSPDGKHIVVVFENHHMPPDLWTFSLETRKFTQLTDSKPEALRDFPFVMPEEVTYPGLDGVEIPALLYRSTAGGKNSKPGAGVVNIHGGPDWLYQISWNPFMSYMASRGWTVLAPNYRGSIGYGRAWQIVSRFEMGRMDSEDVVAGAQFLIREKLVDPARLAVTGRSHGGYLTMTCMTQHPGLWAGGVAIVPVLNLFTSHKDARHDLQNWNLENYGDPVENHDLWVERSPFFFLDRIQAPVQFICGANDVRCPASDAIAAHEKLEELGKKSELWVYPDEGHVFLKIGNIIDSFTRCMNFLSMVLGSPVVLPGG